MLSLHLFCLKNQARTKGEDCRPQINQSSPSNFIAGRPKAALLFWFFGDFRCGVLLFIVMSLNIRLAGGHQYG